MWATIQVGPAVKIRRALATILFSGLLCTAAQAQQPSAARSEPPATASKPPAEFGALVGRWMRPDGGYVITIKAVDASGKLDAGYANPNPLPFQTAKVMKEGDAVKLFFELRAGGYNGSTYTLTYDAANDLLRGVYYQAVAKQQFDVAFLRLK
jgi:uncharacterized protein (DUF2147 family)